MPPAMSGTSPLDAESAASIKAAASRLVSGGRPKMSTGVRGTRIGHKKSRNGCQQCKRRRVKCDESRPCRNCVRLGAECSLVLAPVVRHIPPVTELPDSGLEAASTATPGSIVEASTSSRTAGTHDRKSTQVSSLRAKVAAIQGLLSEFSADVDALAQPVGNSGHDSDSGFSQAEAGDAQHVSTADWLTDMQLIHHFTSNTAKTLSGDADFNDLWTMAVPQIAFAHDFLLHGILALSAIHLSHLNPDKRAHYTTISARHQNIALSRFSPGLSDIGEKDADAYVLHAVCVFILNNYSIAHPHGAVTPKDVAQAFVLLQGIKSIIKLPYAQRSISDGPLSRWLQPRPVEFAAEGIYSEKVDELLSLTRGMAPSEESTTCRIALEGLKHTLAAVSMPQSRSSLVWRWAVSLPQSFLELINQGHPMALVILMHYAALVHSFERNLWFLRGWGANVASCLDKAIQEPWKQWTQWPLQCIREGIDIRQVKLCRLPQSIPKVAVPTLNPDTNRSHLDQVPP